jgi:hypothetical protein
MLCKGVQEARRYDRETSPTCPYDLTGPLDALRILKVIPRKGRASRKREPYVAAARAKKHLSPNHPFRLVAF